jgi:hypothetical protein
LQIKLSKGIELFSLIVLKQVNAILDMAYAILRGVPCSSAQIAVVDGAGLVGIEV